MNGVCMCPNTRGVEVVCSELLWMLVAGETYFCSSLLKESVTECPIKSKLLSHQDSMPQSEATAGLWSLSSS